MTSGVPAAARAPRFKSVLRTTAVLPPLSTRQLNFGVFCAILKWDAVLALGQSASKLFLAILYSARQFRATGCCVFPVSTIYACFAEHAQPLSFLNSARGHLRYC